MSENTIAAFWASQLLQVPNPTQLPEIAAKAVEKVGRKTIFSNIEWQSSFRFEVLMSRQSNLLTDFSIGDPTKLSNISREATDPANAIAANANPLMTFHLRSITVPNESFEYETINYYKRVKNITYPDTVTMNFLEDDYGTVRNYIQFLNEGIYAVSPSGQFVFKDYQKGNNYKAVVYTKNSYGANTANFKNGWLILNGLKYQSSSEVQLSHENRDFMSFDITFSVENVKYYNPLAPTQN